MRSRAWRPTTSCARAASRTARQCWRSCEPRRGRRLRRGARARPGEPQSARPHARAQALERWPTRADADAVLAACGADPTASRADARCLRAAGRRGAPRAGGARARGARDARARRAQRGRARAHAPLGARRARRARRARPPDAARAPARAAVRRCTLAPDGEGGCLGAHVWRATLRTSLGCGARATLSSWRRRVRRADGERNRPACDAGSCRRGADGGPTMGAGSSRSRSRGRTRRAAPTTKPTTAGPSLGEDGKPPFRARAAAAEARAKREAPAAVAMLEIDVDAGGATSARPVPRRSRSPSPCAGDARAVRPRTPARGCRGDRRAVSAAALSRGADDDGAGAACSSPSRPARSASPENYGTARSCSIAAPPPPRCARRAGRARQAAALRSRMRRRACRAWRSIRSSNWARARVSSVSIARGSARAA